MPDDLSSWTPVGTNSLGSVAQPGPQVMSPFDRDTLIRTLYGETGGGQPLAGEQGVVQTMLNRVAQGGPGAAGGPAGVARAPAQYSTWNPVGQGGNLIGRNLDPNSPQYQAMGDIVDKVYAGMVPDITGGAQNYYAGRAPNWAGPLAAQSNLTIGGHTFVGQGPTRISPAAVAGSMYDQGMSSS